MTLIITGVRLSSITSSRNAKIQPAPYTLIRDVRRLGFFPKPVERRRGGLVLVVVQCGGIMQLPFHSLELEEKLPSPYIFPQALSSLRGGSGQFLDNVFGRSGFPPFGQKSQF